MSKKLTIRGLRQLVNEVVAEERKSTLNERRRAKSLVSFLFEGEEQEDAAAAGDSSQSGGFGEYEEAVKALRGESGQAPLSAAISQGADATKTWLEANGKVPKLMELLKMGLLDGDENSEKISASGPTPVGVGKIAATQNFISIHGSVGWPLSKSDSFSWWAPDGPCTSGYTDGRKQPAVCANSDAGTVVLDGHHRWSAGKCLGGNDFQLQSMVFTFPEGFTSPKAELGVSHVAIAAVVGDGSVPQSEPAGGDEANILNVKDIKPMIVALLGTTNSDSGAVYGSDEWFAALLSDEGCKKAAMRYGVTEDMLPDSAEGFTEEVKAKLWDTIAGGISKNWGGGKGTEGAPGRASMPQFGGGDTHSLNDQDVFNAMKSGEINFSDPYDPKNESTSKGSNVILERWTKLAGIKK